MDKSLQDEIKHIQSLLGDDAKENLNVLVELSESSVYQNHPLAKEIHKEIGRLIFENLDEEKQNEFNMQVDDEVEHLLEKAENLVGKAKLNEAIKLLDLYLKEEVNFSELNRKGHAFNARTLFEHMYQMYISDDELELVDPPFDFSRAYQIKAYIFSEKKKYLEAFEAYNNALKWNPLNVSCHLEIIDLLKLTNQSDLLLEHLNIFYNHTYLPDEFAAYLRQSAYYYVDKEKYEIAQSLLVISKQFVKSQIVEHELEYIATKLGDKKTVSVEEAKRILNKNKIPYTLSKEMERALNSFIGGLKDHEDADEYVEWMLSLLEVYATI